MYIYTYMEVEAVLLLIEVVYKVACESGLGAAV
jgi:hypothetical protein